MEKHFHLSSISCALAKLELLVYLLFVLCTGPSTNSGNCLCFGDHGENKFSVEGDTQLSPSTDCNMECKGNARYSCGGQLAIDVYVASKSIKNHMFG